MYQYIKFELPEAKKETGKRENCCKNITTFGTKSANMTG